MPLFCCCEFIYINYGQYRKQAYDVHGHKNEKSVVYI